jgi:hypothetical protein
MWVKLEVNAFRMGTDVLSGRQKVPIYQISQRLKYILSPES